MVDNIIYSRYYDTYMSNCQYLEKHILPAKDLESAVPVLKNTLDQWGSRIVKRC
jgi:hypothetical protein